MAQDYQTSINIPQLIAVAFVGFLAIRWFMSKPVSGAGGRGGSSSTSSRSSLSPSTRRTAATDPSRIEQISAVFPQLDRRTIAWDLQRNGGNVEGTMERVLAGRGLETPPPTFQPNLPERAPVASSSGTASSGTSSGVKDPRSSQGSDLITRYNLQSRVDSKGKEAVPSEEAQKKKSSGWSSDKNARAEALKRRREEMVLAARRKMMERDAMTA